MILEPVLDSQEIKAFISEPSMWDQIAQDNQDPDNFGLDDTGFWLKATEDNELIGMLGFYQLQGIKVEFHPCILKQHRKEHAIEAINKAIDYAFDIEKIQKVNVIIPFSHENVHEFALKVGFQDEGVNKQSFLKNGIIYNQWYMGMTRGDYERSS